jgi:hypothetical protein
MAKVNSKFEPLKYFFSKITVYLYKRPLANNAIGIFFGFAIGLLFFILLHKNVNSVAILLIGAFIGVFAEIFVEFAEKAFQTKKQVKPLQRVFGTIIEEDTWIYVSAWRRDLGDLDHTRLFRNDPVKLNQPYIIGTQFVYGKGDAIALSYIYQAIEKAGLRERRITLEDSEQMIGSWGRSAICIGAHNSKTREILEKFQNPFFTFAENYSTIVKVDKEPLINSTGIIFKQGVFQRSAPDSSDKDYAIILKLKDEYHPEKNILVIAGLGDIGTAGAAYYLLTHYAKLPYEEETFGVLIEVPSGYESARQVEFDQIAEVFIPRKEQ